MDFKWSSPIDLTVVPNPLNSRVDTGMKMEVAHSLIFRLFLILLCPGIGTS